MADVLYITSNLNETRQNIAKKRQLRKIMVFRTGTTKSLQSDR